jgi:hypothetical protein
MPDTPNIKELVERLRTRPTGDPYLHMMVHEAADALDAQAAELAELREQLQAARDELRYVYTHSRTLRAQEEHDALKAELARVRAERVPALEFAEYMAKGAEQLLEALNAEDAARIHIDDGDFDNDEERSLKDDLERRIETRCEFVTGLRSDIYEFRKRVPAPPPPAQPAPPAADARYRQALVWALGAGDDFRLRGDTDGPYWWRRELAQRAGLEWDGEKFIDAAAGKGDAS